MFEVTYYPVLYLTVLRFTIIMYYCSLRQCLRLYGDVRSLILFGPGLSYTPRYSTVLVGCFVLAIPVRWFSEG